MTAIGKPGLLNEQKRTAGHQEMLQVVLFWGSFINVLGEASGSARAELTWVKRLYFT